MSLSCIPTPPRKGTRLSGWLSLDPDACSHPKTQRARAQVPRGPDLAPPQRENPGIWAGAYREGEVRRAQAEVVLLGQHLPGLSHLA